MLRISYIAVKGIPIGGGIETLTEEIGSRMAARGHKVTVYSSRDYGTTSGSYKGMEIVTVPSIPSKTMHKLSICMNSVVDVIKKSQTDIVHIHAVGPSLFSIFTRLCGIPTIVQTHGLEWKRDKWGMVGRSFFKLADRTAVYFPHATTAVSQVQKQYYEEKFNRPVTYIPTGVNYVTKRSPRHILELGVEPRKYILFAARLVQEKGAHFLIEAFRELDTDMKLIIAGDAAYSEEYKHGLRKLSEGDDRIVFTGFVSGNYLEELFSNAYIFCLPSTVEGLPIALLEAMSYGNCCVTSDIPENIEALKNHGYTFKNRNAEDLKRVLYHLIKDPVKTEKTKKMAQDYVYQNYSWDKVTDLMENFYMNTIRNTFLRS
jgi:glycosyltransferase involved in cell wall biosynthesis